MPASELPVPEISGQPAILVETASERENDINDIVSEVSDTECEFSLATDFSATISVVQGNSEVAPPRPPQIHSLSCSPLALSTPRNLSEIFREDGEAETEAPTPTQAPAETDAPTPAETDTKAPTPAEATEPSRAGTSDKEDILAASSSGSFSFTLPKEQVLSFLDGADKVTLTGSSESFDFGKTRWEGRDEREEREYKGKEKKVRRDKGKEKEIRPPSSPRSRIRSETPVKSKKTKRAVHSNANTPSKKIRTMDGSKRVPIRTDDGFVMVSPSAARALEEGQELQEAIAYCLSTPVKLRSERERVSEFTFQTPEKSKTPVSPLKRTPARVFQPQNSDSSSKTPRTPHREGPSTPKRAPETPQTPRDENKFEQRFKQTTSSPCPSPSMPSSNFFSLSFSPYPLLLLLFVSSTNCPQERD
jgi:hypothetical protein